MKAVSQRYTAYLRERYQALLSYIGSILLVIGGLFMVPLLTLPFYIGEAPLAGGFLLAGLPLVIGGGFLRQYYKPEGGLSLSFQEGTVIVLLVWMIATLMGALPFLLATDLSLTHAVFESTSGLTTTGLSVVDVTTTPNLILFYRSFLQLLGGAGFAIIALSAISGTTGAGFSIAEGRSDQLAPHVRQSAATVLRIYVAYAVIGVLALRLAGMSWFDAVNHGFTAIATGGFSTRPESIGYWQNPVIEIIVMVLMILGALNFLTAYVLYRGKFRAFFSNGEVRLVLVVLPVTAIVVALAITAQLHPDPFDAGRIALFETVSALTGTGFTVSDYRNWADFGWIIIIALMILGGGTGSTAGGIKQYRIYVIYKGLRWELQRSFMPQHSVNQPAVWQGEHRSFLNDRQIRQVALFALLYIAIFFVGTCIIAAHGNRVADSMFAFASALGTVGLDVGVSVADAPITLLWTQTVGMFLGRLEFFPVFIGLFKLTADFKDLWLGWRAARASRG